MSTRLLRILLCGLTLSLFLPSHAWSQDDDDDDDPKVAAHIQLIGGVTDAARTQPYFAGALGVRLAFIELDLEVGHFEDVLARRLAASLSRLQQERDLPIQGTAEVPANYVIGTIRLIPYAGTIRPFIGAGGGVARLSPRVSLSGEGISLGDVFGVAIVGTEDKPIGVASVGLRIEPGRVHVEFGYRFVAIFTDYRALDLRSDVATYVHSGYAALGVRF